MNLKRFVMGCMGTAVIAVGLMGVGGCEYPYEPEPMPPIRSIDGPKERRLYQINGGIQVCNESIVMDAINFPGCMMWLNFYGNLDVNVPAEYQGVYRSINVGQHDRLTVTDTSNTVRWFMMKPDYISAEIQDPEWTTHPSYVAFLGGVGVKNKIWSGYVVRVNPNPLQEQVIFKFNTDKLEEESTPHVWLPDSVISTAPQSSDFSNIQFDPVTGMADAASVRTFFNTSHVKIAFSLTVGGDLTIHYIDYSEEVPQLRILNKGTQIAGWKCESPMFSPDGKWVAYNAYDPVDKNRYRACIQKLEPNSVPVLITPSDNSSDPRWWKGGDGYYIVYSTRGKLIGDRFTEEDADGSLGSTRIQKVKLDVSGNFPDWYMFEGDPKTLVGLPFKGGLSPDGKFLCTGYTRAYMYRLQ